MRAAIQLQAVRHTRPPHDRGDPATFALFSALSVGRCRSGPRRGSQHQADGGRGRGPAAHAGRALRQRGAAARAGAQADPAYTAALSLRRAPGPARRRHAPRRSTATTTRRQLSAARTGSSAPNSSRQRRLVVDLTATGDALLAGRPVADVRQTAHERVAVTDPVERLRVLAGADLERLPERRPDDRGRAPTTASAT